MESTPGIIRLNAVTKRYTALIAATVLVGLVVARFGGLAGQIVVGAWSWLLAFRLLHLAGPQWRTGFFACLVLATVGEILLSLLWGLYSYRLGGIPLYVPPGHVFLFLVGLVFAPRVPEAFVRGVVVLAVLYAVHAGITGIDTISVPLVVLFLLCCAQPGGRRLYSLMLVMSVALEFYGTWIGNWTWHSQVPYSGLTSNNPPLAAGAFYCLLDVMIAASVCAVATLTSRRTDHATVRLQALKTYR